MIVALVLTAWVASAVPLVRLAGRLLTSWDPK